MHRSLISLLALITLLMAGCRHPAGRQALSMEEPTVEDLAAVLNVKIWKFHPPMPSGSRAVTFTLQLARRGETTERVAQLRGVADSSLPLTIALRTPGDISSASSRRAEICLAQGGASLKAVMDNYFAGHNVFYSTPLQSEESGRIVLMAANEENKRQPPGATTDYDYLLFLTVEPVQ